MPPSNTPIPNAQQNGHARKRTAPVVPAIPLALSKPRPSKAPPKPESEVKGGAENVTSTTPPPQAVSTPEDTRPAAAGEDEVNVQPNGNRTPEAKTNGTTEPNTPASGVYSANENGQTEAVIDQASRPSNASTDGDATATNTPELSRKPTERLPMRQIRTELPPAFVPSAEQHTPRSNASSQSTRPPQMPPHAHPSHPSTGSIVFGGHDSSASSPAPPQSAGSAYNPPSFPPLNAASTSSPHPTGHSHHTSDHQGPRMYRPGFQQPVPSWNTRQGYGQPQSQHGPAYQPHAHMPFRYPPQEASVSVEQSHVNGKPSRPASQASSTAEQPRSAQALQSPMGFDTTLSASEPRSAFQAPPHTRHFQQQMPAPPPAQFQTPDVAAQMENADALRLHILSQFASPNSADCLIRFSESSQGASQAFSGHKVILSRSPKLTQILSNAHASSTGEIEVPLTGRYMRLAALNDALKYMYGGSLLQLEHPRPGSSAGDRALANVQRTEHALSYVAIGSWLGLPAVGARGVEVAGSLLHWDTIPTALAFALEGGLSQMWTVDDGSEDPFSAASSDDSLGRADVTRTPAYDPYSTALLQRILDFAVHVFPPNFYLDSTAPQLETTPRLPPLPQPTGHESRSSASDPRLSQIRFGEIPVGPSHTTTMISSILLSLPFQLLKAVLEHFIFASRLGLETTASIMRQVVGERERRRVKAQQARTAGKIPSNSEAQLLQNLYWEEFVEQVPQHRVGFRLARRRTGINTPLSSGPE